ncbi:hypothetical protein L210DRAFT_1059974 [Boletus edulis BED1]|uniref:Uncharacterized protein n=1 Tax=Boletus edulis BED1 TaxID=1328754 RepID=A0AAD4GC15_BOLED|nr:hypothetical protein L210DRAFT_1059974 [Boletus edulis BED1]
MYYLESTSPSLRTLDSSPALTGSRAPEPRVGASSVHEPHTNNLYVGDERLPAVNDDSDVAPVLRSYHASALVRGKLYIHAGCPASGRLATLHAYDLATHTWYKIADAPARPRGGTAISAVSLTPDSELVLIRFGGFASFQLPQVTQGTPPPLHIYTPSTDTWSIVYPAPDPEHDFPRARSVHGLVSFMTTTVATPERIPVALLYQGERDASSLGHTGLASFGTTHDSSSHPRPHRPQV